MIQERSFVAHEATSDVLVESRRDAKNIQITEHTWKAPEGRILARIRYNKIGE